MMWSLKNPLSTLRKGEQTPKKLWSFARCCKVCLEPTNSAQPEAASKINKCFRQLKFPVLSFAKQNTLWINNVALDSAITYSRFFCHTVRIRRLYYSITNVNKLWLQGRTTNINSLIFVYTFYVRSIQLQIYKYYCNISIWQRIISYHSKTLEHWRIFIALKYKGNKLLLSVILVLYHLIFENCIKVFIEHFFSNKNKTYIRLMLYPFCILWNIEKLKTDIAGIISVISPLS